jgi:O-antigen/teichoic acid export membrane protein
LFEWGEKPCPTRFVGSPVREGIERGSKKDSPDPADPSGAAPPVHPHTSTERQAEKARIFRQGSWLFLATVLNSGQGVIFWAIASRLVDASSIGFAASLLSLAALASTAAVFGLDQSLIRFLPEVAKPRRLFARSWLLTGAIAVAVGGIAVWLVYSQVHTISSRLYLILVVAGAALSFFSIGFRLSNALVVTAGHSGWVMVQSMILGLGKIVVLAVLVATVVAGTVALLLSFGISYVASIFVGVLAGFSMWPASQAGVRNPKGTEVVRFSLGNYASTNVWTIPDRIAPSLVLLFVSAAATSYFYYGQLVALTLFYLPESICTSAFARAARRGESSARQIKSLAPALAVVTVLLAGVTVLLAPEILWVLGGPAYAAHATLLRIYALSTIPQAGVFYLQSVFNIERRMRELVLTGAIAGLATLAGLGAVFALRVSVDLVPIAWVIGNSIGLVAGLRWVRSSEDPMRPTSRNLSEFYRNLLRPAVRDAMTLLLGSFRNASPTGPEARPADPLGSGALAGTEEPSSPRREDSR